MSVTLDYHSIDPMPHNIAYAIRFDASLLASPLHGWWAEPLGFHDPSEEDGRLYGGNKIMLFLYHTSEGSCLSVDASDDNLMAYRDTRYIVDALAVWSERYGVSWQVECAGEPAGTICGGKPDEQLQQFVDSAKGLFSWPTNFDDKVASIAAKYATRG